MEAQLNIKNLISRFLHLGLVIFLCASCATSRRQRPSRSDQEHDPHPSAPSQPQSSEVMGPPESFGPTLPETGPTYGPVPLSIRPVVLVLGPGMARGYSYVGVLEALQESRIPVGAILGTEMGAFVGALYASSKSINQFEWTLMKFKEDVFREKSGILSRGKDQAGNGKRFELQLRQALGDKDLKQLTLPIQVAFQDTVNGRPMVVDQGPVIDAVRSAMAAPELFSPGAWSNSNVPVPTVSASRSKPFLVDEAKALGLGPVIVVDVLPFAASGMVLDELKGADLVIRPDVKGIQPFDFQKKTDAAFRGKKAAQKHLAEIKRLVGLPDDHSVSEFKKE